MKKSLFVFIIICSAFNYMFGQIQEQEVTERSYYQVAQNKIVEVYQFNIATSQKGTNKKIPKPPLKFDIQDTRTDPKDNSVYYIIKFWPINRESDKKINKTTRAVESDLNSNSLYINSADNDIYFWIRKDAFDSYLVDGNIIKCYKAPNIQVTYGASISVPFKLRPGINGQSVRITPDIALGGYLGAKWRLSHTKPVYMTFPMATLGLSTLIVSDNTNPT